MKTRSNKKSNRRTKKSSKQYRKTIRCIQRGGERLTQEFVDTMYENMWQFINGDTIKFVLNQAGCKYIKFKTTEGLNDYNDGWPKKFWNSIVMKGPPEEGHYVFIDGKGDVWGTYEGKMIDYGDDWDDADDGICHGAALAAALNDCGKGVGPLFNNPNVKQRRTNYTTILKTYKYIIDELWWNKALYNYFYGEITWDGDNNNDKNNYLYNEQTRTAWYTLNDYIKTI